VSSLRSEAASLSLSDTQAVLRQCTDLNTLNQQLVTRIEELERLVQISLSLAGARDKHETFNAIRQFFMAHFRLDAFTLIMRHGVEDSYRIIDSDGKERQNDKILDPNHEWTCLHHVTRTKQHQYIPDIKTIESEEDSLLSLSSGSLLILPLFLKSSRMIGLLLLARREKDAFIDREIDQLIMISSHVAVLLNKSLLYFKSQELAFTDELTGIFNRRYFNQRYQREVTRAMRYKRQLSVLMIDIDHFKQYNDTLGHIKGDQALKQMAKLLESNIRKADVLCRYGGEEFVIILPEIDAGHAKRAAEKLRKATFDEPFEQEHLLPDKRLTISIGVACFPENGTTAHQTLHMADLALYQAKEKGRNRVVTAASLGEKRPLGE
jgi:diguanylate cyclase (GGDEF)-like protein